MTVFFTQSWTFPFEVFCRPASNVFGSVSQCDWLLLFTRSALRSWLPSDVSSWPFDNRVWRVKWQPTSNRLFICLWIFTWSSSTVSSLYDHHFHDKDLSTLRTRSHRVVNEFSCDHRRGSSTAGELPSLSGNMWSHHVTKLGIELTEPQSLLNTCIVSPYIVVAFLRKSGEALMRPQQTQAKLWCWKYAVFSGTRDWKLLLLILSFPFVTLTNAYWYLPLHWSCKEMLSLLCSPVPV